MIESQEKSDRCNLRSATNVRPTFFDNVDEDKSQQQKKRCDCCYDPAVTRYYDPQLEVWFDVCESCRKFLEIQEQLNAVFTSLDEDIRKKIENKLASEHQSK